MPVCFNLYVVNSDGSGLRNLTSKLAAGAGPGRGPASDPAWSPDGQMIAFVRLNAGLGEPIYVVKADGSGLRNLTPKPVGAYADSCLVARRAEDRLRQRPRRQLRGLRHERQRERATEPDAQPSVRRRSRLVARRAEIAFVSNRDGSYGVYVMNADGSGQRRLAQHSP